MIKIYKKYRTFVFAFYNRNASAFATNIKPENEYAKNRIVLNPTPFRGRETAGFQSVYNGICKYRRISFIVGGKGKVLTVGVKKTAKKLLKRCHFDFTEL